MNTSMTTTACDRIAEMNIDEVFVTREQMDAILDLLGIDERTEASELRAIRRSIVQWFRGKVTPETEIEEYKRIYTAMSASTATIDDVLWHMGEPV